MKMCMIPRGRIWAVVQHTNGNSCPTATVSNNIPPSPPLHHCLHCHHCHYCHHSTPPYAPPHWDGGAPTPRHNGTPKPRPHHPAETTRHHYDHQPTTEAVLTRQHPHVQCKTLIAYSYRYWESEEMVKKYYRPKIMKSSLNETHKATMQLKST